MRQFDIDEAYRNLAVGIVEQACADYQTARKRFDENFECLESMRKEPKEIVIKIGKYLDSDEGIKLMKRDSDERTNQTVGKALNALGIKRATPEAGIFLAMMDLRDVDIFFKSEWASNLVKDPMFIYESIKKNYDEFGEVFMREKEA